MYITSNPYLIEKLSSTPILVPPSCIDLFETDRIVDSQLLTITDLVTNSIRSDSVFPTSHL
jgi:hypothetical protein